MKRTAIRSFFLLCTLWALAPSLSAQGPELMRVDSISVLENGFPLQNPWAGGLDLPQFSAADLNFDGIQDLYIYDRAAYKSLVFLNTDGTASGYEYSPEISAMFPTDIEHWALLRDYNCDGRPDLFISSRTTNLFVEVLLNTGTGNQHQFTSVTDTLLTVDGFAGSKPLFVAFTDIPAIEDIDGDGDLDILTFDGGGNTVELHKNLSMENSGACGLDFNLDDPCWGNFQEDAFGEEINLNFSCRTAAGGSRHAGSTVTPFDEDGDGDLDLLLGDLIVNQLTFLRNAGTTLNADMDTTYLGFPAYDNPVNLNKFVAAFYIDVDIDGRKDLLAVPNEPGAYANIQNIQYYQNVDMNGGTRFSQTSSRFLQNTTIDVGTIPHPAFFDYNNDGLLDLIVGNFNRLVTDQFPSAQLTLYENTGTATAPEFSLVDANWLDIASSFSQPVYGFAPTFGDLDGDGDQDMVLGGDRGELHYFENTAPAGQDANFTLSAAEWFGIDVGISATPFLVDLNRDGLLDLVVGETAGTLNLFLNSGTATSPVFPAQPTDDNLGSIDVQPECCVGNSAPFVYEDSTTGYFNLVSGSYRGGIFLYESIDTAMSNVFPLTTDRMGGIYEGLYSSVTAADLTGDGNLEWIVGNRRGGLAFYSETGAVFNAPARPEPLPFIELFPNPSPGNFTLRLLPTAGKRLSLEVIDVQGRKLLEWERSLGDGSLDFETEGLSPGLYFLRFQLDGKPAGTRRWMLSE